MSLDLDRPYLVIPRFIEQPTWGVHILFHINKFKTKNCALAKLAKVMSCMEVRFYPPLHPRLTLNSKATLLSIIRVVASPLSPVISNCRGPRRPKPVPNAGIFFSPQTMPLLIKFTQALGNSFQIHVKKSQKQSRWKPKPESWYYLEDGVITYGIKKGAGMEEFKRVCLAIEEKMIALSTSLKIGALSYGRAKEKAESFIKSVNPWRFVNTHRVKNIASLI